MPSNMLDCGDFLKFQDALKQLRELDDKIVYALNTSIPTESFRGQVDAQTKCKDLYQQLSAGNAHRNDVISKCISIAADKVKQIRHEADLNHDDTVLKKKLRAEQTKLRLLQVELSVEQVVKERSQKVFHERCRSYYYENDS